MQSHLNILYIGKSAEYLQKVSGQYQLTVTAVPDSLVAVNFLKSNAQPDAIVCDYHLPGQNGLFVFDWLRQRPAFNTVPFILLINEFNAGIAKSAFAKRVDDFYVTAVTAPEDIAARLQFLTVFKKKTSVTAPRTEEVYKCLYQNAFLI